MGLFRKSSWGSTGVAPQPDPYDYEVMWEVTKGAYVLAEIVYKGVTNFEGRKILLAEAKTLKGLSSLDPHFLKLGNVKILARFRPDEDGIHMAFKLLEIL